MIIGLGGKGGSGKSLAARYLVERHNFEEINFAGPLKEAAARLFQLNDEQLYGCRKGTPDLRCGVSPRDIMQRLGDFCRDLWPEIFIEAVKQQILSANRRFVVSDVRFLNEAEALVSAGAYMVRIERIVGGLAGEPGRHVSENDLDRWAGWHAKIDNNHAIEYLRSRLDDCVKCALVAGSA